MNIYTLLEELVKKIPNSCAVVDNNAKRQTSFRELLDFANNIQSFTQTQSVSKRAIITLPRSMEYVATLIGLHKGGIACVPLTESEAPARLDFIKKELGTETIIDSAFVEKAKAFAKSFASESVSAAVSSVSSNQSSLTQDECLFFYTSGSTGSPKGILYNTQSILQCIQRNINILGLCENSVYASSASFSFVATLFDVFSPLCAGACLHIIPDSVRKDSIKLMSYLNETACTHTFISPQMLTNVLQYSMPALQKVVTGSEKVTGVQPTTYEILNYYGMSEASVPVMLFRIDKAYDNTPIGKACEGMFVYVLDAEGKEVAEGEEGEICVAGGISQGYFNLPELQAAVFTTNPFATSEHDAILLRTGDIGKKLSDGNIQYINRRDWMVKINGQRVELGEIEAAVKTMPEIHKVAIKDFVSETGQTYVCAYYTVYNSIAIPPSEKTLREHLATILPPYMQPRFCIRLESLPINANGKLDRKALMPPNIENYLEEYEPPRGNTESALCAAFEYVFTLPCVGRNDIFASLGGDSIQAVILAKKASELLALPIAVSDIYIGKTPKGIAEQVEAKKIVTENKDVLSPSGIIALDKEHAPLTFAEKLLITEQMLDKDAVTYNLNPVLHFHGALDIALLQKSLTALIARHSIFTAFYVIEDGKIVRKLKKDVPLTIEKISCALEDLDKEIEKRNVPYDLTQGPLYRFTVFEISSQKYALLASFHHTICDSVSFSIFIDELATLYTHNADISALPAIDKDYFQYAYWQEKNLSAFTEKNQFFIDMFKDGIPQNAMPCHALRPSQIPLTEKYSVQNIAGETVQKLHAYAREMGITLYTLLMGVTALLTSRYTGSEDIVLGTGMSGRDVSSASIMGMFSKELPIRTKPCRSMTFAQYLAELGNVIENAKKNQSCSLEAIISALTPERDSSRRLFYDVTLNYLHQIPVKDFAAVKMSFSTFVGQKMPVDLAFEIARNSDNSLQISLNYSSKLYEEKIIVNMLELFTTMLERIACGERGTLAELSRLPKRQEKELLNDFCGKECIQNADENVVTLFRKQVQEQPNALAVVSGDTSLSYAELDAITDRLAQYLIAHGAKEGRAVAILVARNLFMPIGTLAVLKTGAAYVPLDPAYPVARLHFMLQDTGTFLSIVDDSLKDLLDMPSEVVAEAGENGGYTGEILLTSVIADLPSLTAQSVFPELHKNAPMVFLYTSGTTGVPKGVMWSHAGLTSFCTWYTHFFKLTAKDKVTAYAGFSFDANAKETLPALTVGACVYIIPEEMRLNLPILQKYYNDNGITLSFMTTQVGRQFATLRGFTSLRVLTMGGEGLAPFEPTGDIDVYNLYGPTEGTCVVSGFHYDKYYDRPPVGKPTYNTDFYVLDDAGKLVPAGVEGELFIGGRQVALGYHNRPDVTEKVFLPNPYAKNTDDVRMYKTGDAVRWLGDGNLEILGRRDSQVKIRGFRVELGEIENRIRSFTGILHAVLISANAPGGGKCAVAYIVAQDPNTKLDIQALNAFIVEKLPEYMVPASTIQVDTIPLTPNGKVDTKKLPEPVFVEETEEGVEDVCDVRPLSRLQSECTSIVESVLGHTHFSVTTNLLRAGLASLNAIMVMTKLSDRYGIALSVNDFLANPTILQLENLLITALLESHEKTVSQKESTVSQVKTTQAQQTQHISATGQSLWPLSENQMGVYYECAKNPDSILYNIPLRIDLSRVHKDAQGNTPNSLRLREALTTVIHAHPILKTRFLQEDGAVWQCQEYADVEIEILDCNDGDIDSIAEKFVRPFDLLHAPLCRISLVQSHSRISLLFDAHHCIFDGVSTAIFLDELRRAYEGEMLEKERFSAVELAQKEYIARESEQDEQTKEAKEYIQELLKNYQGVCELPADLVHDNKTGDLAEYVCPVDKNAVNAFCQKYGITPAALFLAASNYTLYRFLSLDTLYLATISNGRSSTEVAKSLGMFVRTLPLAFAMENGENARQESVLEFIENTQKALRLSIKYEDYSFSRVSQDYGFEPAIMYACELGLMETQRLANQDIYIHSLAPTKPKFKLSIHVEERNGDFVYALQYDNARYSHNLIQCLSKSMAIALQAMLVNPQEKIAQVSLLDNTQKELLYSFGNTPLEGEKEIITAIFERIAKEYSEKTALVACDQSLTFAELNALSNRLAHSLIKRGVSVEDKIAFMLERTSHVLIAMLGIMKAGCAFIPIDPTYPKDRVEHVLTDSNAPFLLVKQVSGAENTEYAAEDWQNALDIEALLTEERNTQNPVTALKPENLAYAIYTSGSTGKPKGVLLTHAGIANYVLPHPKNVQMYALKQYAHTLLSITTVAFDMFLKEAFGALMNGVTLVFADEESTRDPMHLTALFEKTKANAFSATPSRMLDFMDNDSLRNAILSCDVLMCGGEKYSPLLLEHLKQSKAHVFNSYGPTEITVSSNAKELITPHNKENKQGITSQITVGAPLYNTREYIVDKDNNILPIGVTGELLVGGRGVARGYNNLAEETAKSFITFNGERVYRTGDLAAWTADGEILILGRNDGQIKLRGLRIELGEIEKALHALPDVKASAVIVRKIENTEHLCAYCVADSVLDFANIRTELAKTLTHYMVPTAYAQLESMPRTPNGKLDTKSLPLPSIGHVGDYIAPANELETALCEVFSEILQIEKVGAEDNFFDNGGTSLGVTRLLGLAHKKGIRGNKGQGISYSNVFACPTPRQLAHVLRDSDDIKKHKEKNTTVQSMVTTDSKTFACTMGVADSFVAGYDFSAIHTSLLENTLDAMRTVELRPVGNALFTGASGFLGITLLYQFLKKQQGKAYCLLRKGKFSSVEKRLSNLLYFYFDESFKELIGSRIILIEGDVTDNAWLENMDWLGVGESLDTVFNCAANVRHFAHDDSIARVNVGGAKHCIELCQKTSARLIHISTVSIGGFSTDGMPPATHKLSEQGLYFGQQMENQYVQSKFLAEYHVLTASMAEKDRIDAKIMRVGNLMGHSSSGEFQINAKSNSFAGRLRALSLLGYAPYTMADQAVDLSPVDSVAEAILLLSQTATQCRIYHPVNNHSYLLGDLIDNMLAMGISLTWTEQEAFTAAFDAMRENMATAEDMEKMEDMVSLIAYQGMTQGDSVVPIKADYHYTVQTLKRLQWQWPLLGREYQRNFLNYLRGLGYFD